MSERVLYFDHFPTTHGAQRDTAGNLWRVDRIEAPYCWAEHYDTSGVPEIYRIEVTRRRDPVPELRMAGAL